MKAMIKKYITILILSLLCAQMAAPVTNTNIIDLKFNILQIGSTSIRMDPNLTGVVDSNFEFINNVTLESGVIKVHRMGDLRQDGVVDIRDAARCNSILAGIIEPTPYDVLVGDLNKNGEIDQADLTTIANMVIAG